MEKLIIKEYTDRDARIEFEFESNNRVYLLAEDISDMVSIELDSEDLIQIKTYIEKVLKIMSSER